MVHALCEATVTQSLPLRPDLDGIRLAATTKRLVADIVLRVLFVGLEQVRSMRTVNLGKQATVSREKRGTLQRGTHELVWIPSNGVSKIDG